MPAFQLPDEQIAAIATFLHSQITAAAYRRTYQIMNILVGDAKAGKAYFNGEGKCSGCHSEERDLKGIGAKYDPETLQGKIVMPRAARGGGGGPTDAPPLDRSGCYTGRSRNGQRNLGTHHRFLCDAAGFEWRDTHLRPQR